jgi:hypothetical protein
MRTERLTVDLDKYPDLVVIYLGMTAHNAEGAAALAALGPGIEAAVAAQPDGLLAHDNLGFSDNPPSGMFRQYWRDFESLEKWVRLSPHMDWWKDFLRDPKGTEFWHETYSLRGGIEAIYDNVQAPLGLLSFAPSHPARGPMFSARQRLARPGMPEAVEGAAEDELYPSDDQ